MGKTKGSFTIPGESGYEKLTLELAEKWGADVVRDSDGTKLSPEILNAGYGVYSTICIIRDHNEWAQQNPETQQQSFLMSHPVIAENEHLRICLLDGFYKEQFSVNDSVESLKLWQVFDRTTGKEVKDWEYSDGYVIVNGAVLWHKYTVNFLAYRIWEEISMYNHITNSWDKEHLLQIDPRHKKVQDYLKCWLTEWCESHPSTTVVRFTSMFYNFVWIWGDDERCRNLYSDWASYDFTVSPAALDEFEKQYGYRITSEDFINGGKLHVTHMPAPQTKLDWMDFINKFVTDFGKELIDIVHHYGKKAYVFYDDSWVGVEPWGKRFGQMGFDGLIKCVFSGFEARLCAGVDCVDSHEIRLHPYLFPVGLGGSPTFSPGGNPTLDAKRYWKNVRRALLREKIDRIGLGGYLSLTLPFPDFNDYIEKIADEFRMISAFHNEGKPYKLSPRIAVLTFWGKLRSWTCSGHFHENPWNELIHINESLSGLPFEVEYINFDDLKKFDLQKYDVIINAGFANSAWSGGDAWNDETVLSKLTEWVYKGGVFLGVNEPSAAGGGDTFFRMSHVLGVDEDLGDRVCHGRYSLEEEKAPFRIADKDMFKANKSLYCTSLKTRVFLAKEGVPCITEHTFGKGKGIYLSGFVTGNESTRMLMELILWATGKDLLQNYLTDNCECECAYYENINKLVVINNSETVQKTTVKTEKGSLQFELQPFDISVQEI